MKHEKFINFLLDINNEDNEVLVEAILEAYGTCFFGISLRKEAENLLESLKTNKALTEGVLEKLRALPRGKIMGMMAGILLLVATTKGMAATSPVVIDTAANNFIEHISGGDDVSDTDRDVIVKELEKVATSPEGKKAIEQAKEKQGDKTDSHVSKLAPEQQKAVDNYAKNIVEKINTSDKPGEASGKTAAMQMLTKLAGDHPDFFKSVLDKVGDLTNNNIKMTIANDVNKALGGDKAHHIEKAYADLDSGVKEKVADQNKFISETGPKIIDAAKDPNSNSHEKAIKILAQWKHSPDGANSFAKIMKMMDSGTANQVEKEIIEKYPDVSTAFK